MAVEDSVSKQLEGMNADERAMFEALGPAFEQERLRIAKMLASKDDSELFGQTEFDLRDRVHQLGARSLEAAVAERQKKGGLRGC